MVGMEKAGMEEEGDKDMRKTRTVQESIGEREEEYGRVARKEKKMVMIEG